MGVSPGASWESDIGPVLSAGPTWTRYGFRRLPFASKTAFEVAWAPLHTRFGMQGSHRRLLTGGGGETSMQARATAISVTPFYGYGNETPEPVDADLGEIWAREVGGRLELIRDIAAGWTVAGGLSGEWVDPSPAAALEPQVGLVPGLEDFALGGIHLASRWQRTEGGGFPTSGLATEVGFDAYPIRSGGAPEAFSRARGEARAYVPLAGSSTLALRVGGAKLWGTAPIQHAIFLGSSTLRGYRNHRFAGDASVYGNGELRVPLGRIHAVVARGQLGTLLFGDVGRVWAPGEESSQWHPGFGAGLWFTTLERRVTAHVLFGVGEGIRPSAGIGLPF